MFTPMIFHSRGGADADDDLGAEDAADADEDEDGVGDDDNVAVKLNQPARALS